MPFSARTNWDTEETAWAQAVTTRRKARLPLYDLSEGNPTRCGFPYDPALLDALQQPAALLYQPDPLGLPAAREAICTYYREHNERQTASLPLTFEPDQLLLTTSTSEAYSILFRLLCDPGDEVLIAQPSYPLFDFLAALDDVKLVPYPLFYDYGWHLDLHSLRQKIGPRTRAIVIVHPNNPTGNFTHDADRKALESICVEFGLALIVDEVFLDYGLQASAPSFVSGEHPALTFVLSGLSKICALPQMKVAWIAASGPRRELEIAMARLEVIADTFLSVSAPLQLALSRWLNDRASMQQQIRARTRGNLAELDTSLAGQQSVERLHVEAGWYAIVRAPALGDSEQRAMYLLAESGIVVHPGSFFGIAGDRDFVISLLPEPEAFQKASKMLIKLLGAAR